MAGETLSSLEKEIEHHKNKPWAVVLTFDHETSQYMVLLPDFQVATVADNRTDAINMADECLELTIRTYLEEGIAIPEVLARQPEDYLPQTV